MLTSFRNLSRLLAAVAVLGGATALPSMASAQDFTAMINARMAQMNQMLARGQQGVNNIVAQKMQDPAVQRAYQIAAAQARAQGRQPQDFQTYAYYYAATNGFSAQGLQNLRNVDASNQAQEQAAFQALQQAQQNRSNAIAGLNSGFSNNQNTFGNSLLGNSTFVAPNGYASVLPHTWQANTYHNYNGTTFYVDNGGRYYAASNGYWVPLTQR